MEPLRGEDPRRIRRYTLVARLGSGGMARCLAKRPDERATVAELMEIITANLTPVTSATAFWPQELAEFIRSYQARFTADAPAWPATVADFGWTTQGPYPTTLTVFNSQGTSNYGGYDDPQADQLISASVSSSDPDAVKNEAAYLTTQQPVLFQPNADQVFAWKKTLSGPPDSFANLTQSTFTPELWYFTKS
jgi:hypothetical protein